MTAPGIYNQQTETGKFHIGDELVICRGALEFGQLIEQHMGLEAAEYFRELLSDLLYMSNGGYDDGDHK